MFRAPQPKTSRFNKLWKRYQAIQQQVQNNLKQAGFTDIQIMPSSFLVRAKDSAGNPVIMVTIQIP